MRTWIVPRSALSSIQLKIAEMPSDEHVIIFGPAGSGKTQVLLHRAGYLAKTYQVPVDRFRLFVSTDMAREYLKPGLELLGLPDQTLVTFDDWYRHFYENHISKDLPRFYINLKLDFERIRSEVLQALERSHEFQNTLEFALVDDGQDFTPEAYKVLSLAARHITVFADFGQKVAESQTSKSLIIETLKFKIREEKLLAIFRNALHVANLASYFVSDEGLRREFLKRISIQHEEKEMPLCYVAPSFDKEIDQLAATIQMRQSMNEKVGIIVPSSHLLHELAKDLKERGVRVEKVIERGAQNVLHEPYDFGNDVPKITTFQSIKGLAFDSVFMPHLTERAFHSIKGEARQRMLFMGMARARQWVYMSTIKGSEFHEITLIKAAEADGHLLII